MTEQLALPWYIRMATPLSPKPEEVTNSWGLAAFAMKVYGGHLLVPAFMLGTWIVMAKPMLEKQDQNEAMVQQLVKDTIEISRTVERTAEHQKTTTLVLDRITSRIVNPDGTQ